MSGGIVGHVVCDELQYYFVYLSLFEQNCGIRTAVLAIGNYCDCSKCKMCLIVKAED